MITTKQWIAFKEYRKKEIERIKESEEYKRLDTDISSYLESLKHDVDEPKSIPTFYSKTLVKRLIYNNIHSLFLYRNLLLNKVPKETVEECLNWLVQEDKNA